MGNNCGVHDYSISGSKDRDSLGMDENGIIRQPVDEPELNKTYKIVVIGNSGAGKTCVVNQFWKKKFIEDEMSTIGVAFVATEIEIDGVVLKLNIWDTAGQERFAAMTGPYFKRSNGAIIVYDITGEDSFENVEKWRNELRKHSDEIECSLMVVGNKLDMEDRRKVGRKQGQEFAKKYNALFFETSAKTGENVDLSFRKLVEKMHRLSCDKMLALK